MASFLEGVTSAVREAFCVTLNRYQNLDNFWLQVARDTGGAPAAQAANFLYNYVCSVPPQQSQTPFAGGQCSTQYDIKYGLTHVYRRLSDGSIQSSDTPFGLRARRQGPVTAVYVRTFGQSGVEVHHVGADGDFVANFSADGLLNKTISATLTQLSVTRTDGGLDNCGSPTPVPTPAPQPGDNIYNTNVTYTDNRNTNVTIPVAVVLGYAQVNINGEFEIPIQLRFSANPTLNVQGSFNVNNNRVDIDSNPNYNPSGCSPSPNNYKPPVSIPPGSSVGLPDVVIPAPTVQSEKLKIMRGCIVTVTTAGGSTGKILENEDPDIIIPNAGYVQFQVQVGSATAWMSDMPVKNKRNLIMCPWPSGAIDVKGTPREGVTWTITPVYTTDTFDKRFPPES